MENIESTFVGFDYVQSYRNKLQTFLAKIVDVQKENFDVLKDRPLMSFFKITYAKDVTITFSDNSLPEHIKNKHYCLVFFNIPLN